MPESDELNAAIGHIKHKVDSMDQTLERLLRVNGKALISDLMEQFRADKMLKEVYLAIDGSRTQKEISKSTGHSEPTVSRRIETLKDLDLIELIRSSNDGKVYQYTKMEKLFKISKLLRGLDQ